MLLGKMRRPVLLLATAAVALLAFGGAALGVATMVESSGGIQKVKVVREDAEAHTASQSFVTIPGASVPFVVPAGERGLFLARFSGTSWCGANDDAGQCLVRIVAQNTDTGAVRELGPITDSGDLFDGPTSSDFESHSIERSGVVGSGTWIVKAQFRGNDPFDATPDTGVFIRNWSLVVEKVQAA